MSDKYDLFYYVEDYGNTGMTKLKIEQVNILKQLGFIRLDHDEYFDAELNSDKNPYRDDKAKSFGIPPFNDMYDYDTGMNSTDSILGLYIKPKGKPETIGKCRILLKHYVKRENLFQLSYPSLETIYIDSMDVSEEGFKNLGSLFIKKIKEFARMSYCPEGVINICLTAHPTEHSFYTKHGFKIKPGLGDTLFNKILLLSKMFLEQTGFKITNLEESKDPSKRLEEMVYIVDMKLNDKTRTQTKTSKRTQSKTSKRTNRTMSKSIKI